MPSHARDDDRDLGARFQAADPDAIREVYRRYSGAMLTIGRHYLQDPHRAADAVQQAFLQAWKASARFDPEQRLSSWLYAITRRVCIDLSRTDKRAPLVTAEGEVDGGSVSDGNPEDAWERWQVRAAVDELPPAEREIIRLAHLEGLTLSEVAERLDIPLGTVKSRAFRAHKRLALRLQHLRCAA
jgi:RNA polymerase sigma-70 factor (ECF subfamily)